jgi:hypothetical protein
VKGLGDFQINRKRKTFLDLKSNPPRISVYFIIILMKNFSLLLAIFLVLVQLGTINVASAS